MTEHDYLSTQKLTLFILKKVLKVLKVQIWILSHFNPALKERPFTCPLG